MCGCGGGGAAITAPLLPGGTVVAPVPAGRWRVSWMDQATKTQTHRDWPTQPEAFAHAGIVGGTVSLTPAS
jgi:hypothetical protein